MIQSHAATPMAFNVPLHMGLLETPKQHNQALANRSKGCRAWLLAFHLCCIFWQ